MIVYNFVPNGESGPWSGYLAAKDVSTGETIIIDDYHGSATNFALSPDGERIAYLRGQEPAIYTWGEGSETIDVGAYGMAYKSYSSPEWSPDGQRLALHTTGDLTDGRTDSAVIILDLEAETVEVVAEYLSFGQRVGPELRFSPDGNWLASINPGEITDDGQPVTMWVYSLTGSEHINLGFATSPFWQPDGTYPLYTRRQGVGNSDPHQIVLAEVGNWTQETITELEGAFIVDWLDLP